ncbi:MAG: CvpA family protein [Syntrophothermus sp.]
MNYLDYVIAGILAIGFILGYKDGLIRKIIGVAGIILGIFMAVKFSSKTARVIAPFMDNEDYLAGIVAAVGIFLLAIIAATILKRLVHPHDKVSKFANQLLGGLTGILQVLLLMSGLFLFLNIFSFPGKESSDKSILYTPVSKIMPKAINMIGGELIVKNIMEGGKVKIEHEIEGVKDSTIDKIIPVDKKQKDQTAKPQKKTKKPGKNV